MFAAGGTALLAQRLKQLGLLRGEAQTVSGKTIGQIADEAKERSGQGVVRPAAKPIKPSGGIVILKGNLAPEGCVMKLVGHDVKMFRGRRGSLTAKRKPFAAVQRGDVRPGDVVVIRYEGPSGRAGHARDAGRDRCAGGRGSGDSVP